MTWCSAQHGLSIRSACSLVGCPRSTYHYRSCKRPRTALRLRLRELAAARPRYGYRRLWILLRREGWEINHKLVYRLYKEEGLTVRIRRRRKVASQTRLELPPATEVNERWSMDFMEDQLAGGRRLRILTLIDQYSRECLALSADTSFPSSRVTDVLDQVIASRGQPASITVDNGTEFTSRHFDAWAYFRSIAIDFIRPGRPVENAYIESFNGRLREECLSQHWFRDLAEARSILEAWKRDYNETRPHTSLGGMPPSEYARQLLAWGGYEEAV